MMSQDEPEVDDTVLIDEEPGQGYWVKVPEYDLPCGSEDAVDGVMELEELLLEELERRRLRGEVIPERLRWRSKRVDRDGFGPTLQDLARASDDASWDGDFEDEDEAVSWPGLI